MSDDRKSFCYTIIDAAIRDMIVSGELITGGRIDVSCDHPGHTMYMCLGDNGEIVVWCVTVPSFHDKSIIPHSNGLLIMCGQETVPHIMAWIRRGLISHRASEA